MRRSDFEEIVSSGVDEIANVQISRHLMFAHVTAEIMMSVLAHNFQPSSRDFVRRAWLGLVELVPPSSNFLACSALSSSYR